MDKNTTAIIDKSKLEYVELNAKNLILDIGLYQKIEIDPLSSDILLDFLSKDIAFGENRAQVIFDTYCPDCKKESTFKDLYTIRTLSSTNLDTSLDQYRQRRVIPFNSSGLKEHVYIKEYVCSRNHTHVQSFYFLFDGNHLTKVGQTLRQTALFAAESKKYAKYFPDIQKELFTSVKLYSDGVGVAAILYLRRIFEKLINNAEIEYIKLHPSDEIELKNAHMSDKIKILKDMLPDFLVENKSMYSILSSAVHELEEDICLGAYPFIKDSILMILDEEIDRISSEKKRQNLAKELQNFQALLGRNKKK